MIRWNTVIILKQNKQRLRGKTSVRVFLWLSGVGDYQMTHFADKLNLKKVLLKICLYTAWRKEILHLLMLLGVIFTLLCLMIHTCSVCACVCVCAWGVAWVHIYMSLTSLCENAKNARGWNIVLQALGLIINKWIKHYLWTGCVWKLLVLMLAPCFNPPPHIQALFYIAGSDLIVGIILTTWHPLWALLLHAGPFTIGNK